MKKLPAKMHGVVLPLFVTMVMSAIVAAISTVHALGFVDDVFRVWLASWLFSWAIAFPTLALLLPLAQKAVRLIVEE